MADHLVHAWIRSGFGKPKFFLPTLHDDEVKVELSESQEATKGEEEGEEI